MRRTTLWYGQFDLCLNFYLNEAHTLRHRSHSVIDEVLELRKAWGKRMARQSPQPGSWRWEPLIVSDKDRDNLHSMLDFFESRTEDFKISHSGNHIYVYTRDTGMINDILSIDFLTPSRMSLRKIELKGMPDTICLKTVNHRFRSYFRDLKLSSQQSRSLMHFIANQSELRPSPALQNLIINDELVRTQEYYFVDHDDPKIITIFALIVPNLIRRTMSIVADK